MLYPPSPRSACAQSFTITSDAYEQREMTSFCESVTSNCSQQSNFSIVAVPSHISLITSENPTMVFTSDPVSKSNRAEVIHLHWSIR